MDMKKKPDVTGAVPMQGKWLPEISVKTDAVPPPPPSPPDQTPSSGAMIPIQLHITKL